MHMVATKTRVHPGAGISDVSWTERFDAENGARRGSIFCHPMVSSTWAIVDNVAGAYYGQKALNEAIGRAGYSHAASDLGFFSTGGWGNPAEQAKIGELAEWIRDDFGAFSLPHLAVGISAGVMGLINYYGTYGAGDPDEVAAFVLVLPPYDLQAIYAANIGGGSTVAAAAWGTTYPNPLPAHSSPKDNGPGLAGTTGRIYYSVDDPVNGIPVIEEMLDTFGSGWSAIQLKGPNGENYGHSEPAINAINKPELVEWCHDAAPIE